jgi:hypothetical protein
VEDLLAEEYPQHPAVPGRRRTLHYVRVAAGLVLLTGYLAMLAQQGVAAQLALAATPALCTVATQWIKRTIVSAPPRERAAGNRITSTTGQPPKAADRSTRNGGAD